MPCTGDGHSLVLLSVVGFVVEQTKSHPSRHMLRSNSHQPTTDVTSNNQLNDKSSNQRSASKQSQPIGSRIDAPPKMQFDDTTEDNSSQDQKPDLKSELSGLLSKAKEGLSSSSRPSVRSSSAAAVEEPKKPQKSETELEWEQIGQKMSRALKVDDFYGFTNIALKTLIFYHHRLVNASFVCLSVCLSRNWYTPVIRIFNFN